MRLNRKLHAPVVVVVEAVVALVVVAAVAAEILEESGAAASNDNPTHPIRKGEVHKASPFLLVPFLLF
jgi:hypothetical protein